MHKINQLNVPVTIETSIKRLRNIIKAFIDDRLTFGLVRSHSCNRYSIWRAAVDGDLPKPKNHNDDYRGAVISSEFPKDERIEYLWVDGECVRGEHGRAW
jgi:hypothetical protein